MNILGLHFGHDAGVVVLKDGAVASFLYKERHNRAKHACALGLGLIDSALAEAGITLDEIGYCAVTSTQNYEMISTDADFRVVYADHPGHVHPVPLRRMMVAADARPQDNCNAFLLEQMRTGTASEYHRRLFPEFDSAAEYPAEGFLNAFVTAPLWAEATTFDSMRELDLTPLRGRDDLRHGFHYPVVVSLRGRDIPAYLVQHHMAHAASAYYPSGMDEAAVLTHDGGFYRTGPQNGMLCHGIGNRLFPIVPHHLSVGDLYDRIGCALGFDLWGAAGKLMGLAPYGRPAFFDRRFVGNTNDLLARGIDNSAADFLRHCLGLALADGYDISAVGHPDRVTEPVCVDIAASTQKVFEETLLEVAEVHHGIIRHQFESTTANLCYSGGTALNCPANSRLAREGRFRHVFVPPYCDDSGLPLGAALHVWHNVMDQPLSGEPTVPSPYLGRAYGADDLAAALAKAPVELVSEAAEDWCDRAAADLADNKVIAWFEGRSELGPRALGHRSVLADPRHADNWERVNRIKTRESWRPFAPAVLEAEAAKWFHGAPLPSPFMLFTAQVTSKAVPAITHVDNSARIQTVNESAGGFFRLLQAFYRRTGIPMVLNTSFNGRGEPIVEAPWDAIRLLVETELDVLYLDGHRITRSGKTAQSPRRSGPGSGPSRRRRNA
jgi:carbamoyltransferase